MFTKLSAALALFAVAAQVAVAVPPACLIAAVNTQSDPSDMKSVCGDGAKEVQKYISSNCGDNLEIAQSTFAAACKDAGVTVSQSSSTSAAPTSTGKGSSSSETSGTITKSGDSSMTSGTLTKSASVSAATPANGTHSIGTGASGFMTQTANGTHPIATPSSYASGSGSGSGGATPTQNDLAAVSTGGASRLGMDILGLVAVGAFGAMIAM